jgi:hypothetical protein
LRSQWCARQYASKLTFVWEIILKILAVGGPLGLAVMGFVVIDKPPKPGRSRIIWYCAFVTVAVGSAIAAIVDAEMQDRKVTSMLMGSSENFPELYGLLQPDRDGRLPLYLTNAKATPLFDVSFAIKRAGTFTPIAVRNWGTLLPHSYDTGIWIAPGHYQIDIVARNGWFIEMYTLGTCKGQIFQYINITMPLNGGKQLVQSPSDPDQDCLTALGLPLSSNPSLQDALNRYERLLKIPPASRWGYSPLLPW